MEHARFWSIIDEAGGSSGALVTTLAQLPPADIIAFDAWFWAYYLATAREDLWAAVSAIRGGCGDDSFDYFRGWLIGRGEAAVLAAVRDPESLAELIGDADPCNEGMLGAARHAYREADAGELPDDTGKVTIPGQAAWPADRFKSGLTWNEAFYAKRFPKLYAGYIVSRPVEKPAGVLPHDQFWSIIAAAIAGTADAADGEATLRAQLMPLSRYELIGFERWLNAYDDALRRADVRELGRKLLGQDDLDTFAGFRAWLILQGRAAVHAMTHAGPETVLAHATHPPVARRSIMWVSLDARERLGISGGFSGETILDLDTWLPDRAGDPSALTSFERERIAQELLARARAKEAQVRLPLLDQALLLWPGNAEILTLRGRTHHELGNLDAALADLDAVLADPAEASLAHWERARVRLARGDHAGAVADARAAANRIEEARTWLSAQVPSTARRVRHAKFGEGTVIAADTTGSEPKLVIEFASGTKTIASRFVDVLD